jgi:hypothetical protein
VVCKVSGSWSEGQGYTVFNQQLPVWAAASRRRSRNWTICSTGFFKMEDEDNQMKDEIEAK